MPISIRNSLTMSDLSFEAEAQEAIRHPTCTRLSVHFDHRRHDGDDTYVPLRPQATQSREGRHLVTEINYDVQSPIAYE